jgi:hypothetical protein
VVCVRPDSTLAAPDTVGPDDLLGEPPVVMRPGRVMHRYVHRLLDGRAPSFSYSTDGAEVLLVPQRRASGPVPRAVRDPHHLFTRNARALGAP